VLEIVFVVAGIASGFFQVEPLFVTGVSFCNEVAGTETLSELVTGNPLF
jgi:hypothetical protein